MIRVVGRLCQWGVSALLCLLTLQGQAQKKAATGVALLASAAEDSILLRWAPVNTSFWQQANMQGYVIKRYTILRDGKVLSVPEEKLLTAQPVKPLPLPQWEKIVQIDERWGAIAAQALYGKDFDLTAAGGGSGSVMSIYQKSKEADNRYSFALFSADQSWIVAKASGLAFVDKEVTKSEKYLYRVYINGVKADTGFAFIGIAEKQSLPAPRDLRAEKTTKAVMLSWDKVMFSNLYNAYILERSDDNGKTFTRVTKEPIVNADKGVNDQPQQRIFYIDTVPKPGQPKVYRIYGITPFGQISAASDTIHTMVLEAVDAHPSITGTAILNNGILIKWMMPPSPVKVSGFDIERSSSLKKKYVRINKQLLSPADTVFMDDAPKASNYYKVKAYLADGRSMSSFAQFVQLLDSIPPAVPDSLSGVISDSGYVQLTWKANTEADIYGYRVFRANSPDAEFVQVTRTPARSNHFADTIEVKTLTKYIYYKIVALDAHYNPSEYSAVLQLKRPDVVPPVPPVFTNAHASAEGIFLQWQPSTSDDVVAYRLLRTIEGAVGVKMFLLRDSAVSFTDTTCERGVKYQYQVVAIDDSQLTGTSKVLSMQRIDMGNLEGDRTLKAAIDRDNKSIRLRWKLPEGVTRIWVYRAADTTPMRLYKTLDGNAREYIDTDLLINTVYRYKVKLQRQADGSSLFTEEITLNY
ncbi:fibronectin type III domain-containing protein [Chitinophaga rhizophila]|uniref:Fibronectin type-III domain-containing protein n=1 Tax=Chitinophaga rhizophila TaxID=2866212 RepID=A0ABS7GKU2_9BACT|nr:hypothetical protein [Chitinophaga rhizophila]MBW8687740.1 hypothetical protein [Chitinophaga rhizophila]